MFNAILLVLFPFAILPIFLSLERIPQSLLRASGDPVAGLQAFWRFSLLLGVARARLSTVFLTAITTLVAVLRSSPLFVPIVSADPVGRDGRRRYPGLRRVVSRDDDHHPGHRHPEHAAGFTVLLCVPASRFLISSQIATERSAAPVKFHRGKPMGQSRRPARD
ncbi:hypothetical protein JQK88_28075 [Mesorhizobium caraganae]|uniref:hypothetical protein n=1 Tax=Mesorhizobium caraganae TaxID=483206 RepID=UPI00193A9386|nr:hypothetical protein [Mesorhizobium caraganae]